MQKSSKLLADEQGKRENYLLGAPNLPAAVRAEGPVRIKPVRTYNDYVLILQGQIQTESIVLAAGTDKKAEGVVVGVPAGPRGDHLAKVGDRVKFYERSVTETVSPAGGFYAGRNLVVIRDGGVLFEIPGDPVEIVDDAGGEQLSVD